MNKKSISEPEPTPLIDARITELDALEKNLVSERARLDETRTAAITETEKLPGDIAAAEEMCQCLLRGDPSADADAENKLLALKTVFERKGRVIAACDDRTGKINQELSEIMARRRDLLVEIGKENTWKYAPEFNKIAQEYASAKDKLLTFARAGQQIGVIHNLPAVVYCFEQDKPVKAI